MPDGCRLVKANTAPVGAAEGCDLSIFSAFKEVESQKIAAFGSSYRG
ncbi:hypothetical protein PG5_46670 [Pseudomonas sp. G5(2012)]|nr:hypothetical protein PG5_46670 [Pseudomonas sp. G5(2012)]